MTVHTLFELSSGSFSVRSILFETDLILTFVCIGRPITLAMRAMARDSVARIICNLIH